MSSSLTPENLFQQIARFEHKEKGTLSPLRGRASANFQRWEAGRPVSEYVAAPQVPRVQEHLAA